MTCKPVTEIKRLHTDFSRKSAGAEFFSISNTKIEFRKIMCKILWALVSRTDLLPITVKLHVTVFNAKRVELSCVTHIYVNFRALKGFRCFRQFKNMNAQVGVLKSCAMFDRIASYDIQLGPLTFEIL